MSAMTYPGWALPDLSAVGVPFEMRRSMLGGYAKARAMTPSERRNAGRKANRARNRKLSPERRSELAGIAGRARWAGHIKVKKKRPPRLDPEETRRRKSEGGSRGQAKRMTTTTPEQRSEWSRIAGIKAAEKRWAGHERKWPKQKPKRRERPECGAPA